MRAILCTAVLLLGAPSVMGQAVTGFTGGSQFSSYWGSATGDVIGFRFTVNGSLPIVIDQLGVWNADTAAGFPGLTSTHQVGIWDAAQTLITSVTVDPATGTVIGDWIYASITPITLNPGETYTIGCPYTPTDNDQYISSASSLTTAADVTWVESVFPASADLGFVFPTGTSTSFGRFGPNFTFTTVPVELQSFTIE